MVKKWKKKERKRDQITAEGSVRLSPPPPPSYFSVFVASRHLGWVPIIGVGAREEFNIGCSL
jgi:hypothetical protein